jgi:hypothetical protein
MIGRGSVFLVLVLTIWASVAEARGKKKSAAAPKPDGEIIAPNLAVRRYRDERGCRYWFHNESQTKAIRYFKFRVSYAETNGGYHEEMILTHNNKPDEHWGYVAATAKDCKAVNILIMDYVVEP